MTRANASKKARAIRKEDKMKDILSIIKLKNPEDVTQKELEAFQLVLEEAQQYINKLQDIHRSLTGKNYML